ncbi:HlyD family secretion protein, partial [bacterium]
QGYETTDDAQLDTDMSSVSARVPGYVAMVYFTDNQNVKKGDTLIVLDDRDLALKEEQAEAALENAKAMLEVTKENSLSVQAGGVKSTFKIEELKILLDNAQKDYDRYQKMYSNGSVTQQQFEKVATHKEALKKQVDAALQIQNESNARTDASKEQINVAEIMVKQRKIDLDIAKLNHSYAFITAPFDGVVSKKNAVIGQLIQAGQSLCSIIALQNIWVIANFKETQIDKMKAGMKVEVSVDAFPERKLTAKIASFSSATGSKFSLIPPDNASGNYVKVVQRIPVKIEFDKKDNMITDLKPGMSVFVKIILN